MSDPHDLQRFLDAQDAGGTYERALTELQRGRKSTHWMWFVFPQLAGLGASPTARHYAIQSLDEARAYLAHPVLGARLRECAAVVLTADSGRSSDDIFGSIDALKLRSSMTLFARADPAESIFVRVLERFYDAQADSSTDALLTGRSKPYG
jgi:uncharacterized protein (DUF1810 family)